MALLKEDGSLDVERIRHLSIEEYVKEYCNLDKEQIREFWSKISLNESQDTARAKEIDLYIANNGVDAMEFLNKMREKYEHKKKDQVIPKL